MPKPIPKQQTPRLPLEFRTFESYLMLQVAAAIREAFEQWPKMMRVTPTPVRKDNKSILPPQSQMRVSKPRVKRKRNPVAWKRVSTRPPKWKRAARRPR